MLTLCFYYKPNMLQYIIPIQNQNSSYPKYPTFQFLSIKQHLHHQLTDFVILKTLVHILQVLKYYLTIKPSRVKDFTRKVDKFMGFIVESFEEIMESFMDSTKIIVLIILMQVIDSIVKVIASILVLPTHNFILINFIKVILDHYLINSCFINHLICNREFHLKDNSQLCFYHNKQQRYIILLKALENPLTSILKSFPLYDDDLKRFHYFHLKFVKEGY